MDEKKLTDDLKCNSYKTSWKAKFFKAKAEIERLTEELNSTIRMNDMYIKCVKENDELQKKVDKLTEENKQLDRDNKHISKELKEVYKELENSVEDEKKAVKDTAKEILGVILAKEFEKGDYLTDDELHELFKERYGVEVE